MSDAASPDHLKLCLVSNAQMVVAAVRMSCPPPHHVEVFTTDGIVDEQFTLAPYGQRIVRAAADAEAVLVDWRLEQAPVINTLCYHVRSTVLTPVIALCGGGQEDQIAALAAGADDAMTFPMHLPLLQAKTGAYRRLLRDVRGSALQDDAAQQAPSATPPTTATHDVVTLGVLRLDRTAQRVFVRDQEIELTPREFALLDFFMRHTDTLCTRDRILDHVWGIDFDAGTNMVDVYVYFLRRKLVAHDISDMIQTVRGRGYRFALPQQAES